MFQELHPQEHVQLYCAEQHCLDTLVSFPANVMSNPLFCIGKCRTNFKKIPLFFIFQVYSCALLLNSFIPRFFLFLFFRYILVLSQPSVWHENKVLVFLFFARMKASFSIDSFIVIDSYVNTKHFNMILLSNCLWVLVWASVCVFSALLCACFNSFSPIYALLTKKMQV